MRDKIFAFKISRHTVMLIMTILLYRILLDIVYFNLISPNFSYLGMTDNRTFSLECTSWGILLLSLPFVSSVLNNDEERISSLIFLVIFLVSFVPFTSCISAGFYDSECFFALCSYWFCLLLFQSKLVKTRLVKRTKAFLNIQSHYKDLNVFLIGGFFCLIVLYISFSYTGFRLNFNLSKVYELRNEAKEMDISGMLGYLFSWSRAIIPIIMGYFMLSKKKCVAIFLFGIQMLSFGIDGSKSAFFSAFLILLTTTVFPNLSFKKFKSIIVFGLAAIPLLSLIVHYCFSIDFFHERILRRVFFVPNYLCGAYFEFFSNNPVDLYRSSFLRHFNFTSPYSEPIPSIIGDLYYLNGSYANNGLFSDAFCNLGYIGLLIMPLCLVIVMRMLDICSNGLNTCLLISVVIQISVSLIGSTITVVLVTHGLLLICGLLAILKRDKDNSEGDSPSISEGQIL